jgi:hypothetical protein
MQATYQVLQDDLENNFVDLFARTIDMTLEEAKYLVELLKWFQPRLGTSSLLKTFGSIILSVCPHDYFDTFEATIPAVRKLMYRFIFFLDLFWKRHGHIKYIETEECLDSFTHEPINMKEQGALFAIDENGTPFTEYLGSFDSWAHHCLLNGPFHPLTRKLIHKFGVIYDYDNLSLPVPTHSKVPWDLNPYEIRNMITSLFSKSLPLDLYRPRQRSDLVFFEILLGIPPDRSLMTIVQSVDDEDEDISLWSDEEDEDTSQPSRPIETVPERNHNSSETLPFSEEDDWFVVPPTHFETASL